MTSGTAEFLAARAVPGVEEAAAGVFRRTVRLAHGPAVIELGQADGRRSRPTGAMVPVGCRPARW